MSDYTLGDSQLAAERLALLAEVFGPATEAFIGAATPPSPSLVVDVGCGPGHTTRLLADVTGATRVVGLDASEAFIERARVAEPALEFHLHDATTVPFPVEPASLVFARYLLAHLPDPVAIATLWATQLAPGGRLLLDEVEAIDTEVPAFAGYLALIGETILARGADLYVGRLLAPLERVGDARCVTNEAVRITPPTASVARLYAMNLTTFRHDPYVTDHVDPARVDALARDLDALQRSPGQGEAVWTQRQLAFERP